jgi:Fic family protein
MVEDINESRTVDLMFRDPYLKSKDLVDGLGVSVPTANRILSRFESLDVLHEVTGRKCHRLYCATGVLDLLR